MKRIIYFVLAILVCGIYVGCSENEIDLYDQTPRINFYGSTTHVRTLVDTDYVKKEPYAVDSFEVRIQGDFLKENRDFCVKVTPNNDYQNSVDVLLESKYTYTDLDTVCQIFYYKINRPKVEAGRNVYGCYLEFDLNNPLHQFDKGMFIMDVCQRVWDDLEDEDIDVIKQAYREYKEAGNPPILGEEGDEIEYE